MEIAKSLTVWGLVFDIVGALLIAKSIALTKVRVLAAATLTVPGANFGLFRALLEQRADAVVGLCGLLIGFGGQIGGALIDPVLKSHVAVHAVAFLGICGLFIAEVILLWRIRQNSDNE